MKKHAYHILCALFCTVLCLPSCDEDDSYAELREREGKQIASFLKRGCEVWDADSMALMLKVEKIKVIPEEDFYADTLTDVSKNEYVLFRHSGIYMQIVRRGTGKPLAEGEAASVLMGYYEYNIAGDSLQTTNKVMPYDLFPDKMNVRNDYGTFTASFTQGAMKTFYSTSSVPSGWLVPLRFVRLGRQSSADAEIALVRLILPSTEGQMDAAERIYPCFYEISYQAGR